MNESEFDEKRRRDKKALFTLPAVPIILYTEAELALIAQRRDKKAEDALLTRTQVVATRNSRIYCELADLG